MGTTSPDNIRFPDGLFPVNISADLENLAEDVQSALLNSARSGTSTQRTAATSLISEGGLWQDTDGMRMIWRKQGVSWVPAVWRWAGTTTQMNSFTAPVGFEWYNTSEKRTYIRGAGVWELIFQTTPFASSSGTLHPTTYIEKNSETGNVVGLISVTRTVWTSSGTTTLGTIATGFRPSNTMSISVALSGAGTPRLTFGQITSTGAVTVHSSPTNGQSWMASASFAYST